MAAPPNINVPSSPPTTAPPARGAEMLSFLQSRLQKNRAPPLVHSWDFWHDRQDRSPTNPNNPLQSPTDPNAYEDRLVLLASVNDIRAFWSLFNNFDTTQLPLRDSVHLFKHGVKPIWEDPRNVRGGAWTFRVPKAVAPEFWQEVCMLAIGEQFQAAVERDDGRETFRDDVCGVSLGVRFGSMLVQVWNRDGEHEGGVRRLLETVLVNLTEGLQPREGSYYYKKHSEHAAFGAGIASEGQQQQEGGEAAGNGEGQDASTV